MSNTTESTEPTHEELVAAEKALSYQVFEASLEITRLAGHTAEDVDDAKRAKADYLRTTLDGNANPYVPWTNPAVQFQCPTCNLIISANQEHPLHPEDEELLKHYPAIEEDAKS